MGCASLAGRSILVIEDEPLIALSIKQELDSAGATVITAPSLAVATPLVNHDNLSAAIVDFGLTDGDASPLCATFRARGIPFIVHSGYECEEYAPTVVIPKPALPGALVDALAAVFDPTQRIGNVRRAGGRQVDRRGR